MAIIDDLDLYAINGLLRDRISQLEARLMATFDDSQVQALWATFDGLETSDEAISGDMVRTELTRRGLIT